MLKSPNDIIFLNMLATWDYFANHPVVLVLTAIMIFILIYLILFRVLLARLFPSKKFITRPGILILLIVIPAVLTVPVFGTLGAKYGNATDPPVFIAHDASFVYLISPIQKTGKSVYRNYRMHKVDMKTGEETNRYVLTRNFEKYNSALIGEILWVEFPSEKKLSGINISNGKKEIIDDNYLQSIDKSGRNSGIQNFTVDFSKSQIHIFRKDGTDTVLNPFNTSENTGLIIYSGNEMNVPDNIILTGGARKKLELNGDQVLPDNYWINGSIILNDPGKKQFIISGYKTTENTDPLIECFNYDLKKIWVVSTPVLPEGAINNSLIEDESILLNIGNYISSINLQTGKLNWCRKI